jgi:hypothetical protein
MTDLTALIAAQLKSLFLGKRDLVLLRKEAEDIDTAYGETLDTIAPAVLVRLTKKSCAA